MIDRKDFRRRLGRVILDLQDRYKADHTAAEILPELISALVSLAILLSREGAQLKRDQFLEICLIALDEEWPR